MRCTEDPFAVRQSFREAGARGRVVAAARFEFSTKCEHPRQMIGFVRGPGSLVDVDRLFDVLLCESRVARIGGYAREIRQRPGNSGAGCVARLAADCQCPLVKAASACGLSTSCDYVCERVQTSRYEGMT